MAVALKSGCFCGEDDAWANAAWYAHAAWRGHVLCKACEGWPERNIIRMSRENAVFVAESTVLQELVAVLCTRQGWRTLQCSVKMSENAQLWPSVTL